MNLRLFDRNDDFFRIFIKFADASGYQMKLEGLISCRELLEVKLDGLGLVADPHKVFDVQRKLRILIFSQVEEFDGAVRGVQTHKICFLLVLRHFE